VRQTIDAEVSASHFIPARASLQAPSAKPLRVILRRAFQ
jgi:hypothetical protein